MDDMISRQAAIDEIMAAGKIGKLSCCDILRRLPSAQSEWNNHTVACLLAEMFGDDCACNFNGIDEWLPEKCEVIDSCPHPVGVACWEQFLKHVSERRTNYVDKEFIEEELKRVSSIQPKQKTGQWLVNSDGYYPYCSICQNEPQGRIMTDYCPNCGAKMERRRSDENEMDTI